MCSGGGGGPDETGIVGQNPDGTYVMGNKAYPNAAAAAIDNSVGQLNGPNGFGYGRDIQSSTPSGGGQPQGGASAPQPGAPRPQGGTAASEPVSRVQGEGTRVSRPSVPTTSRNSGLNMGGNAEDLRRARQSNSGLYM